MSNELASHELSLEELVSNHLVSHVFPLATLISDVLDSHRLSLAELISNYLVSHIFSSGVNFSHHLSSSGDGFQFLICLPMNYRDFSVKMNGENNSEITIFIFIVENGVFMNSRLKVLSKRFKM